MMRRKMTMKMMTMMMMMNENGICLGELAGDL